MASIPKKVAERLGKSLIRFQRVLADAKDRDVNESDTVTIVTDILAGVFGFDKYTEITSEQAIRGTYCDLAVKIDGSIKYLLEVKAIGLALKDNHLRQAMSYGANQGIPWVVLTNGIHWEIYRIKFDQPISHELICDLNLSEMTARKVEDQERLFLLCREGLSKAAIEEFHEHVQIVNRFVIGAIIQTDEVVSVIRRELRRLGPGTKITAEEIRALLPDVLKRDVMDGELAEEAQKKVRRQSGKPTRRKRRQTGGAESHPSATPAAAPMTGASANPAKLDD